MSLEDHAEHNKKVSVFLHDSGEYPDWVIITSYYSAMKFAEWSLFPYESDGIIYETFNELYTKKLSKNFTPIDPTEKLTKHTELKNLISSELPNVSDQFNWLYSTCMNARYNSKCKIKSKLADTAVEYLEDFEFECKVYNQKLDSSPSPELAKVSK